jgi:hypothetical protein
LGLSQVEAALAVSPGFSGRLLPVALDVTDESRTEPDRTAMAFPAVGDLFVAPESRP